MEKPYQNKEWLRTEYLEKERPTREIAEDFDVHPDTITYFRNKHNIPAHGKRPEKNPGAKYKDKQWLKEQYWEKERNTNELAEECGCSNETIRRWLNNHDLGVRSRSEQTRLEWIGADERKAKQAKATSERNKSIHPSFFTRKNGYEVVACGTNKKQASMHRLLAVAEYGIDAVEGMCVHHKNEVKWDNRPENIELMTRSDHMKHHNETTLKGIPPEAI